MASTTRNPRFHSGWEPTLLETETIATGQWWYDADIEHRIELRRLRFDYKAEDVAFLWEVLDIVNQDYIDPNISEVGDVYRWYFSGPIKTTSSGTFQSILAAKEFIETLGKSDVHWKSGAI